MTEQIPGLYEPGSPVTIALAQVGATGAEVARVADVLQVLAAHMSAEPTAPPKPVMPDPPFLSMAAHDLLRFLRRARGVLVWDELGALWKISVTVDKNNNYNTTKTLLRPAKPEAK